MRSVVRTLVATATLAVSLTAGLAAQAADTAPSLVVGPIRQRVSTEGTATVYAGNKGEKPLRVAAVPLAYSGEQWSKVDYIHVSPSHFTLAPHRQQAVSVRFERLPDSLCSVYGVGFTFDVAKAKGEVGLNIKGQGIAQLVVVNAGATAGDCLSVIPGAAVPEPPAAAASGPRWPVALAGAIVAGSVGWWLIAGRKRRRKPKPGRHTPGYLPPQRVKW